MTRNDLAAAVSLATEEFKRDGRGGTRIGGLAMNKATGRAGFGYDVAKVMESHNCAIVWDMDDRENGAGVFNSIYEFIAAEIHAPGGTLRARFDAAQDYAHEAKSGVTTFAKWFEETWGCPLFRCTTPGSGKNVTVITVLPDLEIDTATGETAVERQRTRDINAFNGQANAAYKRMAMSVGEGKASKALRQTLLDITDKRLPGPTRDL